MVAMNSSAISVSGLRKVYRDKTVLDGADRLLDRFDLVDAANKRAASYSDGMRTTGLDPFQQGAASGTQVCEIVGDDPVEFVEAFVRNYPEGQWRIRERERLINAIDRAAGEDTGTEEGAV